MSNKPSGAPTHYTPLHRLHTFTDSLFVDLAENVQGVEFEILTLYPPAPVIRKAEQQLAYRLPQIKSLNVPGLQKIVEAGFMQEYGCFFTVYERTSAADYELDLAQILDLAGTLKTLKESNHCGFWIAEDWIGFETDNKPCLRWPGWFEVLLQMPDLPTNHLPQNVLEWASAPAANNRPNFQDDQYQLTYLLNIDADELSETVETFLATALNPDRPSRFADYPHFIKQLKAVQNELEPEERLFFPVYTKPEDRAYLETIIEDMNAQQTYFWVNPNLSDKGYPQGKFTTPNWSGSFYLDRAKNYIFIPANSCQNQANTYLQKDPNTFLANYEFVNYEHTSKYQPTENVRHLLSEKNELAVQHKTQTELLKEWSALPEQEKKFALKEAILCEFEKVKETKNGFKNFRFLLKGELPCPEKIKSWKREKIVLCVNTGDEKKRNYVEVGVILDYDEKNRWLTLKDLKCDLHELPWEGKLEKDVTTEVIPFKKQIDACEAFKNGRILNPRLCNILVTPEQATFPAVPLPDVAAFQAKLINPDLKDDETQAEAVLGALDHKPVYLIQGPPGTGKTTVIVELIGQLIKQNPSVRILIVSQSNMAVDNVLKKLIEANEKLVQKNEAPISFVRLASGYAIENNRGSEKIKPHTYSAKLSEWSKAAIKGSKEALRKNGNKYPELEGIIKDWHSLVNNSQKVGKESKEDKDAFLLNDGSRQVNCLTAMLMKTQVVGATCIHITSSVYRDANLQFDFVIMDESSKATAAETLVPINMGRNIVLIGDHKQLPPVITKEEAIVEGVREQLGDNGLDLNKTFGISLFERLIKSFENDPTKQSYISRLNIQYRMPEQIGDLVSKYFYENKIQTGGDEQKKAHGLNFLKPTSALLVDTSKNPNHHDNDNAVKRQNPCNIEVIKGILAKLNEQLMGKSFSIGVIAAYRGQVELLNRTINFQDYLNLKIEINTVDSFQGSERDVIIYDIVKSSQGRSTIGFQMDYRRLNVAMSRAQKLLIMVGDGDYLINRADFKPEDDFKEFKLRQIVQELKSKGYSTDNFSDFIR